MGNKILIKTCTITFILVLLMVCCLIIPVSLLAGPSSSFEIIDATDSRVSFDRIPERIVVIGRGPHMALHTIYMFPKAKERIKGYEVRFKSDNSFLPLVDPLFENKIRLGTNPGPEELAALHPDLIIIKGSSKNKSAEALKTLNIPVVYLGLEGPERFFKDIENLGLIFGNPKRAKEIYDYYQECLNRIDRVVKEVPKNKRPEVLVIEYNDRGGKTAVKVPAIPWIQTVQAITAGGRPVWIEETENTDGWTITNFEQIAAWDPEKIFVIIWYTLDPEIVITSLKTDKAWNMLKAVKNNEIYAFPSDIFGWDSPEPRWILGMLWLTGKMHPDRFSNMDIQTEIIRYFQNMYFLKKEVVESEILPDIKILM